MSANRERPYVYVLPEDDPDKDIAVGFSLGIERNPRQLDIEPSAGGWTKVRASFEEDYVKRLRNDKGNGHIVLLVDFDNRSDRLEDMQKIIPDDLRDRVFIIGPKFYPEELTKTTNKAKRAQVGQELASCCREGKPWREDMRLHNENEVVAMTKALKHIFFS